jgi:A-macroglobulin receptor binding domain
LQNHQRRSGRPKYGWTARAPAGREQSHDSHVGLTFAPVLVVNLRTVFRRNRWHNALLGSCDFLCLHTERFACDRESLEEAKQTGVDGYEVQPDRVVFYLWPSAGGSKFQFIFRPRFGINRMSAPSVLYDYYNLEANAAVLPLRFNVQWRIQALGSRNPLVLRNIKCQFRFLNSTSRSLRNPRL